MIPRGFSGELPTALEPDLLQGVPLSTCLGGWGQHWSSSLTARNQESLSQRTTKIDAFLSHDWGTRNLAALDLPVLSRELIDLID